MTFEPSGDLEKSFIFEQIVVGGAVPKNYFPAVEKGLADSMQKGPLAGYPVVGVKATLYDGSFHPVDSSEMAFKMCIRDRVNLVGTNRLRPGLRTGYSDGGRTSQGPEWFFLRFGYARCLRLGLSLIHIFFLKIKGHLHSPFSFRTL